MPDFGHLTWFPPEHPFSLQKHGADLHSLFLFQQIIIFDQDLETILMDSFFHKITTAT